MPEVTGSVAQKLANSRATYCTGGFWVSNEFERGQLTDSAGATVSAAQISHLGPYEIHREIGRGAMGTVYEAVHSKLRRKIALKILPRDLAASPERYERFQREMALIGRLEHPNIVLATDAGQINGVCYIAMQLINGADLAEVLVAFGRMTSGAACEAIRQAALGLSEIQRHGMVHRDIKPSNLLLSNAAEIKILDLGIASIAEDPCIASGSLTMAGSFLGTPDYIAPERINSSGPIDIRSDIYSLGCTLYHLLSGQAPFSGKEYDTFPKKLVGHAQHAPDPAGLAHGDISPELRSLVGRMMAKSPHERIGDPLALAEALQPYCDPTDLERYCTGDARTLPSWRTDGSSASPAPKRRSYTKWIAMASTIVILACSVGGVVHFAGLLDTDLPEIAEHDSDSTSTLSLENSKPLESQPPVVDSNEPARSSSDALASDGSTESMATSNGQSGDAITINAPDLDANPPSVPTSEAGTAAENAIADDEPPTTDEHLANQDRGDASNRVPDGSEDGSPRDVSDNDGIGQTNDSTRETAADQIADDTAKIADSTEAIADNTERIALTLEEMRSDFQSRLEEVVDEPQNPSEWYANARTHSQSGNQQEARKAFLQFFTYDLNVVDPHLEFATLLKLQEGLAGAREVYQAIPGDRDLPVRRFTEIMLSPVDQRQQRLHDFTEEHPEFAPAFFELGRSYEIETFQRAVLIEVAEKRTAYETFLKLHDEGKLVRYYLDPSKIDSMIEEVGRDLERFAFITPEQLERPVTLSMFEDPSTDKWNVVLQFAESAFEPSFRMADEDEFKELRIPGDRPFSTTGRENADQASGVTVVQMELPGDTPKGNLEIQYVDRNGAKRGPFKVVFDPLQSQIDLAWRVLSEPRHQTDWADIDVDDNEVWFNGLLYYGRFIVKELKYGINVDAPNKILPIPKEEYDVHNQKEYYVAPEEPVRFVVIQVTFIDDTKSPVLRFEPE